MAKWYTGTITRSTKNDMTKCFNGNTNDQAISRPSNRTASIALHSWIKIFTFIFILISNVNGREDILYNDQMKCQSPNNIILFPYWISIYWQPKENLVNSSDLLCEY